MPTLHEIHFSFDGRDPDGMAHAAHQYQIALDRYAEGLINFPSVVRACKALALASRARRRARRAEA
jgi:hypothetical protein